MTTRRKLAWVALLYFAEGFPFGLIVDALPVYFRVHGVSLAAIGLLSSARLPWTLKFFWAPLVDRLGERRHWIVGALLVMAAAMLVIPLGDPSHPALLAWLAILTLAAAAATQDVAIDAYTIALVAPGEEGVANGIRVSAYRAALIIAGGALLVVGSRIGWNWLFWGPAALMVVLAACAWRAPPVEIRRQPTAEWARNFGAWLRRPGALAVLLFVLLYKLGDASMGPMVKPFWLDRGLSPEEIAFVSTTLGVAATVGGALTGGIFTSRFGIFRGLLVFGVVQALSNLGYAFAALGDSRWLIYCASLLESFTGGLGTAAFLAFLMHICERELAATQFALLSALFNLPGALGGAPSGYAVQTLGYSSYFALTFLLSFPALALLPWVRDWIHDRPASFAS